MAIIADRESEKWFKPGLYKWGADQREYQPDFVADTAEAVYMIGR
jgi:type III restriction enzyme